MGRDVGHCPIMLQMECPIVLFPRGEYVTYKDSDRFAWHKVDNYEDYKDLLENIISNCPDIYELSSLQCRDRFCQDERYKDEID